MTNADFQVGSSPLLHILFPQRQLKIPLSGDLIFTSGADPPQTDFYLLSFYLSAPLSVLPGAKCILDLLSSVVYLHVFLHLPLKKTNYIQLKKKKLNQDVEFNIVCEILNPSCCQGAVGVIRERKKLCRALLPEAAAPERALCWQHRCARHHRL